MPPHLLGHEAGSVVAPAVDVGPALGTAGHRSGRTTIRS
jgi:hypothetical protein